MEQDIFLVLGSEVLDVVEGCCRFGSKTCRTSTDTYGMLPELKGDLRSDTFQIQTKQQQIPGLGVVSRGEIIVTVRKARDILI
jgi:hypothetical protein